MFKRMHFPTAGNPHNGLSVYEWHDRPTNLLVGVDPVCPYFPDLDRHLRGLALGISAALAGDR